MSKRGRTDTAIERLNKSIQSGNIGEIRILIHEIEDRIDHSFLPYDENPIVVAVSSGNIDALTFLIESIFGDNSEVLEHAYNIAIELGKCEIADYLTYILDQREVNEGEADEDDSDEDEPEVGGAAAMAESTVRPSISISRTLKNLEKLVSEVEISPHSPCFGIPSAAASQYCASAAPAPLPESASSASAPAPYSLEAPETPATGNAEDSGIIFV